MIGLPLAAQEYLPGEQWLGAVGAIPLVAGALALVCLRIQRPDAAIRAFAMGAFLFVWVSFSFVSQQVDAQQRFHELLAQLQSRSESPELSHFAVLEPSWVFYSKSTIKPVYLGESSAENERQHAGARSGSVWVRHPASAAGDYINESDDHFVLTTRSHYEQIRDRLPRQCGVVAETKYFLKDETIVAIGRQPSRVASAEQGASGPTRSN